MLDNIVCSYCGGPDVTVVDMDYTVSEPYGGEVIIQSHVFVCNTCGFKEDDSEYNDPLIIENSDALKRQAMVNILTELNSLGLNAR